MQHLSDVWAHVCAQVFACDCFLSGSMTQRVVTQLVAQVHHFWSYDCDMRNALLFWLRGFAIERCLLGDSCMVPMAL